MRRLSGEFLLHTKFPIIANIRNFLNEDGGENGGPGGSPPRIWGGKGGTIVPPPI
jgi:hypothetical protein